MALNSLLCADVPLRTYITHSLLTCRRWNRQQNVDLTVNSNCGSECLDMELYSKAYVMWVLCTETTLKNICPVDWGPGLLAAMIIGYGRAKEDDSDRCRLLSQRSLLREWLRRYAITAILFPDKDVGLMACDKYVSFLCRFRDISACLACDRLWPWTAIQSGHSI